MATAALGFSRGDKRYIGARAGGVASNNVPCSSFFFFFFSLE